MPKSIQELIDGIGELGSPPDLYTKLENALNNENTSLAEIAVIAESDPGLAARIIAISNSPVYKIDREVDNIERAITIIGAKQMREVVLATTVVSYFDEIPNDLISEELFWKHSITCAHAARTIARACGQSDVEKFYLMGLLHDIGRLILFSQDARTAIEIMGRAKAEDLLLVDVEEEMLGFNHAELGGALLEKWGLPRAQVEAVCYHHAPSNAPNDAVAASVTHLADIVANYLQIGTSGERFVPRLDAVAWDMVGIEEDDFAELLTEIETLAKGTAEEST